MRFEPEKEFRVMKKRTEKRAERKQRIDCAKRRIEYRLRDIVWGVQESPMFKARNIHYEVAERDRGFRLRRHGPRPSHGSRNRARGSFIDENLKLRRFTCLYHESDHVLNIAYNAVMDGDCLEDIELRRNDEVFLNALGAQRILRSHDGR
jgi:hypothetical protein